MKKRRNWLKKSIAMITLVATVIETGFSSVATYAAVLNTEDGIEATVESADDVLTEESSSQDDVKIEVISGEEDQGSGDDLDVSEGDSFDEEGAEKEEAPDVLTDTPEEDIEEEEAKAEPSLDVSDNGISGSGYDEVSVYIDTRDLANNDTFSVKFTGSDSASYNPVLNEELDKTNGGRYDFTGLNGTDFKIRATAADNVILSYKYNEDGYPVIKAESGSADKVLTVKTLTAVDDSEISAVSGEGYDSINIKFNTEDLTGRESFALYVESKAAATVDGKDATEGIDGLGKNTQSLTIEDLDGESFVAYVVSGNDDSRVKSTAEVISVADGEAAFVVDKVGTKRVYEYEDSKISVIATLEKADAVPDDAEFVVTEVDPESTEYNYDTYMNALNENAEAITGEEADSVSFNDNNTLLYDIGFFVTKDGTRTEFEPEEGSVRFEIKFKDQQLAETESDSSISVVHLPLKDEVKEDVDTTAEATNITTDDVEVEVVNNNNTSVANGTVEFNLNDLSVVAIIDTDHRDNVGTLEADPGEPFTTRELLGGSWTYGVTANTLNLVRGGDAETNFATKTLNNQSCSQTGMTDKAEGSLHSYYIVENFTGQQLKLKDVIDVDVVIPNDSNIERDKLIISQDTQWNTNPHVTFQKKGRVNVQTLISNMLTNAASWSETLAARDSVKEKKLDLVSNAGKVTLDISNDPAGTYYFNVTEIPVIKNALAQNGAFSIKKNDNQKIVFNYTGTDAVYLNKYILNNSDSVGMANHSSKAGTHIEDIIFNIPNATSVSLNDQAGIFIAPAATVEVSGVGGGWIVANVVNLNCEWHFTNGELPKPGDVNVVLPVQKKFEGGAGKWRGGFKFTLQEISESNHWANVGDAKEIILNGGDSEEAIGQFELTFDPTTLWYASLAWNDGRRQEGFTKVCTKWYRVSEEKTYDFRDDVEYNIYEKNPWNEAPNTDYWYIHLFIYSDDNYQNMIAVPRTARKNPDGYDYARYGLPCEESRPIIFKNRYRVVDTEVELEGIKEIEDYTGDVPSGKFEFSLYDYVGGNAFSDTPKVIDGVSQVKKNVGPVISFDKFRLNFYGATHWNDNDRYKATEAYFYFLIKETGCEEPFIADESQFIAKVTLKKENGQINPSVKYFKFSKNSRGVVVPDVTEAMNDQESSRCTFKTTTFTFTNKYKATGSIEFYGLKVLAGRTLKKDEFEFTLTGNDRFNTNESVRNDAVGKFKFSKIEYTQADVNQDYIYTITETDGGDSSIVYDLVPKTIKVMIRDNDRDGKLEVTTDPENTATQLNPVKFNNTYNASGEARFSAKKLYTSKNASTIESEAEFSFKLEGDKLAEPLVKSVKGTGTVDFFEDPNPTVTFSLEDLEKNTDGTYSPKTFNYTINEILPEGATADNNYTVNGITYDPRVYYIKVVVSDNGDGTLNVDYNGAFGETPDANDVYQIPEFVNEYDVDEVSVPVGGNKELHGKELERGEFTFILSAKDDKTKEAVKNNTVILPETEVKNGEPESEIEDVKEFRFGNIVFKAVGKYSFLITEEQGSEEGIQYSTAKYTLNIEIKDDGKGKLYVASRDLVNKDITFINTKDGNGEVPLYAKKELKGRKLEPEQFTFELKDAEGNVIETKSNDASGNVSFTPIKYYNNTDTLKLVVPGETATFDYTINEVIPNPIPKGYVYDDHVEEIKVTVTLNPDGSLKAEANNATFIKPAVFNNEYTAKGSVDFEGTKEITGRKFEKKDEGKFFAELYDETETLVEKVNITKDTKVFGLDGGAFEFTPIVFTQDDLMTSDGNYLTSITRKYTVIETGKEDGIKMDQTVYTVIVTVTDPGTGELNVTKQYKIGESVVSGLNFVNVEANGSVVIQARKKLVGSKLKEGTFEFVLKDDSKSAAVISESVQTNKDGGLVIFNSENTEWLKYDIDDVAKSPFTYTLSEKYTDKKGYILDQSVYTVKVYLDLCLDENGVPNGSMETHTEYYKSTEFDRKTGEVKVLNESEWKEVPEALVEFVNEYDSTGSVQIHANKILTGGVLEKDKFKFLLYDELGNLAGEATNGNDPDHPDDLNTALFPEMIFTQEDLSAEKSHQYDDDKDLYIKYYTVMEYVPEDAERQKNGTYKKDGYTYDTGVYTVVVTLRDNGDGTIKTDWYTSRTGETHDVPTTWEIIKDTVKSWFGKGELKNADFTNKYDASGVLELSAKKILTGKELGDKEFRFELAGQLESGENFKDVEFNDADGNVKFSKILYTTKGSYKYTIRELPPDGAQLINGVYVYNGVKHDPTVYTVNVTVEDPGTGMLKVTAEIEGKSAVTSVEAVDSMGTKYSLCKPAPVDFTNTYDCEPISITLGGDKTLVGRDLKDENEFSFTIKSVDGNPKKLEQTVNVNKDIDGNFGTFEFDKITFEFDDMLENGKYLAQKTFAYVISEDIPEGAEKISDDKYVYNNVTYDTRTYNVVITVTNSNGKLAAKITRNDTELTDPSKAASFRNYYDTEDSLILEVQKLVLGTDNTDTAFEFELTGTDINGKLTTTAYNGETANFAAIKYTLEDIKNSDGTYAKTYNYTVREVPGSAPGYHYSDVVYTATVDVTSDGKSGKIDISEPKILKNQEAYDKFAMEFTNTYSAEGDTDIPGYKELVGKDLTEGEFTFALSEKTDKLDENGNIKYTEIARTTNDATGNFSFKLAYTQDDIGEHFYTVNEVIPDGSSEGTIDYDKSFYTVAVTVKDDKSGHLDVSKDIRKGTVVFEKCVFINKEIKPNQVEFDAIKTLSGKALKDDMFTFSITGDNNYYEEVTNKGEYVSFSPVTYSYKDIGKTFTYVIKEHGKSGDGISYDATQYKRIVKVLGFDENNTIKLDVQTLKNGEIANEIKFENKYESTASVKFSGHKFLEGFDNEAIPLGKYTFELLDENNNTVHVDDKGKIVADGGKEQKVTIIPKNATDPTDYSFDEIKFDQNDLSDYATDERLIKFKVKEVIPVLSEKAPNVKYAENEYNITVRLYYDVDGMLKAETSTKEGVSVNALDFTNSYAADGEIIIDGVKTITGKDIVSGAYTFNLTGEGQDQEVTREAVNAGNVFTFNKISYKAEDIGLHVYTVKETASRDGSVIDTRVYRVKVNVEEGNEGKLAVSKRVFAVDENGNENEIPSTQPITFNNKFEASGSIDIEGLKKMHNRPLKAGEFTFVLKDMLTGEVKDTVSSNAAPLNNKTDLEASAAFKFKALEFTQNDLKSADGTSYLSETRKYYSVEEVNSKKGGVKYSDNVYIIEVTIKSNGTKDLEVSKKVSLKNKSEAYSEENNTLLDSLKLLFGRDDAEYNTKIIFDNTYDSECVIDPPILRKQIMGKKIVRGDFTFEITGPGLRSMGEDKTGYKRTVKNGYAADGTIYGADGKEIPVGEIYVGDIKYKYIDLIDDESFTLEEGAKERTFVYTAVEVPGSDKGTDYSKQKFQLTVKVVDDGEGHLYTIPEIKDMKWVPLTDYRLSDEQMTDTFLNIFNQEGSIDLAGIKKLEGRKLTKDDKFEFTLTDDANPAASVTVQNTVDKDGIPSLIEFNAKDVSFLNYRYGAYEKNPDRKEGDPVEFYKVDDTGTHTYTIVEKSVDSNTGIKYDTAAFKVYVDVKPAVDEKGNPVYDSKGHGKLDVKVTNVDKIYSNNNKVKFEFAGGKYFEFTNEFKATGKLDINGIKYVKDQSGKAVAGDLTDKYGFALYSYDDATRTKGKSLVDVKNTDKDGKFTLDLPEYDQEILKNENGEYAESKTLYYRIIETKPSDGEWTENNTVFESKGVIYDNTEYDVDVTITFDGTQTLKLEKTIKNAATGDAVTNVSFTNIKKDFVTINGTKTWVDDVQDASSRPDVVLNLYSSAVDGGKKKINTYTIKAPGKTYEFTTDASGKQLPAYDANGKAITYRVEELPIDGYLSEQKGFDFYNTRGKITIRKIDADTGVALEGATLAILDGSSEIEKWTSEVSAHVVKAALKAGKKYTLHEISAPSGYDIAEDMTFTVPADGSDITVTMKDNKIIGSVKLTKRDSATRAALAGAEFSLYNDAGTRIYATGTAGSYKATSSTSNGVFAVNSSGELTISDLPYGAYYFVETKAPEGYTLSTEKVGFTIAKSNTTVEVSFLNKESVGAVRLRKVGEDGERSLAGAVFELYAATPRSIGQAVSSTVFRDAYYRYGTYTTNSSGEIYVDNLPWDDYYFVEVQAPEGYEIAKDLNGDTLAYAFTVNASTAGTTIDLGNIVNPREPEGEVLGERRKPESGVLGVRSTPKGGVLGTRVTPATGDASAIALWIAVMLACIGTIVWLLVDRRKKRVQQ